MKKVAVVSAVIGILVLGAYLYVRFSLPKPNATNAGVKAAPAGSKSITKTSGDLEPKPAETAIDLRPRLIAKLQELVKKGSNGLYDLAVREIEPDVLNSRVSLKQVRLTPNASGLRALTSAGGLPEEVFRLSINSIDIKGLGLKDLVSKDVIDLKEIYIRQPIIEVVQQQGDKKPGSEKSLYQKLMGQLNHLAIGKIIIEGASIRNKSAHGKTSRFDDVSINMSNILLDSTTQYDHDRFLFAKEANISVRNLVLPSPDKLYDVKVGGVSISSAKKILVAKNIAYLPRFSKQAFQAQTPTQKERYAITIPTLTLTNIDWWQLATSKGFAASEATVTGASLSVYLDRTKPVGKVIIAGFPHQLLMKVPTPINIKKLRLEDAVVRYEELSPASGQTGKVFFTAVNGTVTNLTNRPELFKKNPFITAALKASFLDAVPIALGLRLNLPQYRTGAFSATLQVNGFNGPMVNSVSKPLGLFEIKEGTLHASSAQVKGDNQKASGIINFTYDHLHVNPLEKGKDGTLNKKHLTGFVANTFVLKDENPGKNGEVRTPTYTVERGGKGTFFNLLWKTTLVGILKTIGAPEKLANQQ